jgi:hypothetical protein
VAFQPQLIEVPERLLGRIAVGTDFGTGRHELGLLFVIGHGDVMGPAGPGVFEVVGQLLLPCLGFAACQVLGGL